jgi:chaperonin GroEL
MRCVAAGADPHELKRGIEHGVEIVVSSLKQQSKRAVGGMLRQVGTISANGDKEAGDIVARALAKVGNGGFIALEDSSSAETHLELVKGMQLERGYLSRAFVTDPERMVVNIENCRILIFDGKISAAQSLLPILEQVAVAKKSLLIVCGDVEGEALNTLVLNSTKGTLQACAVKAPEFGDYRMSLLQDLAVVTGGRAITEHLGIPLEKVRIEDLGSAKRILVNQDKTRIIEGAGDIRQIRSRTRQVQMELARAVQRGTREQLQQRLSKLSGWAGVIRVGAHTEAGSHEKRMRIASAIHATRAAIEEGIVPGGGVALLRSSARLKSVKLGGDAQIGLGIVSRICQEPIRHLVTNAGHEAGPVVERILSARTGTVGFNAVTGKWEDLMKAGVVDPMKVTRNALQNASSAAAAMLTTGTAIAEDDSAEGLQKSRHARREPESSPPFYETNRRVPVASAPKKEFHFHGEASAMSGSLSWDVQRSGAGGGGKPPGTPPPGDGSEGGGEEPAGPEELTVRPVIDPKPEHVVQNKTFVVEVSLQLAVPESEPTKGEVKVPPGEHTLLVHLLLGMNSGWDELRWSSTRGTLKKATFGVVAPRIEADDGSKSPPERRYETIICNFYREGRWCGEAVRNIEILLHDRVVPSADVGSPPKAQWRDFLTFELGAEPPDLLVRIQKAGKDSYEWNLLSPHLDLRPANYVDRERMQLDGGPQRFVKVNFDRVAGAQVDDTLLPVLKQRCREIYESTPESFRDAYWRLYHAEQAEMGNVENGRIPARLRSIQFISDEPYVPWDLMLVRDNVRGKGVKEEILSIRHAVGRWINDKALSLRQKITIKHMTVFASDYKDVKGVKPKLPWAVEERDLLVSGYSAVSKDLRRQQVEEFFRKGRSQAVHFSCHGSMNVDIPSDSALLLEDFPQFVTAYLEDDDVRNGEGSERPLVFLNACQLAGAGPTLGLITGWPQTFLNVGASACVAPLWSVIDEKAKEASLEFYKLVFKEGRTLGAALQELRKKWIEERSITFLSYVLYGDPMARIAWCAADSGPEKRQ